MCCHILAKSINFTYDTLRWFAMRYGYHTMKWKALAHRTRISIAGAPDQQCFPQTPDVFLSLHIPSSSIQSLPPYYLFIAGKNRTRGPPIRDNLSSRMAAFLSLRWIPVSALLAWLLSLWPSETVEFVVRRAQAGLGNTWLRLSQKTSAQMTRHS